LGRVFLPKREQRHWLKGPAQISRVEKQSTASLQLMVSRFGLITLLKEVQVLVFQPCGRAFDVLPLCYRVC